MSTHDRGTWVLQGWVHVTGEPRVRDPGGGACQRMMVGTWVPGGGTCVSGVDPGHRGGGHIVQHVFFWSVTKSAKLGHTKCVCVCVCVCLGPRACRIRILDPHPELEQFLIRVHSDGAAKRVLTKMIDVFTSEGGRF